MQAGVLLSRRFLLALGLISALCLLMFTFRVVATGTFRFYFIPQNLALAWLSLLFAWLLVVELGRHRWLSWQNLALTFLWLVFLPNAWYVLTDFLHVYATGEISPIFDIAMIASLVFAGFIIGFASLYLVHLQLLSRWKPNIAHGLVAAVILLCSFGIYLGRDLRWNTWDVITHPEGLIINVSDRVIDPFGHPRAITITLLFFVLIATLYAALWLATGPHKAKKR